MEGGEGEVERLREDVARLKRELAGRVEAPVMTPQAVVTPDRRELRGVLSGVRGVRGGSGEGALGELPVGQVTPHGPRCQCVMHRGG